MVRIRTCKDARILISEYLGIVTFGSYEVQIGTSENSKTRLVEYSTGVELTSIDTEGILDCERLRPFWVSWSNGEVKFGMGTDPGVKVLLTYTSAFSHSIGGLSLVSALGDAVWEFSTGEGELHVYYT